MKQTRIELEASVAACVLMDNKCGYHVDVPLRDVTLPAALAVLGAFQDLQTVDILIAKKWAEGNDIKTNAGEISDLLSVLPTSHNFMHYLTQLKAEIYRTKVEQLRASVIHQAKSGADLIELSKQIEAEEENLSRLYLEQRPGSDLAEVSSELINRIEHKLDNQALIPTGWQMIDEMFGGGFLPNELIIIAARPSVGKTAAALQLALECSRRVVLFSLEMSKEQIAPRLLSALSLTNTKIATRRPSQVPEEIRNRLLNAAHELDMVSRRIIVVDQPDQTIESIRRQARREVEAGAELVILDYLQLLDKEKAESRERAVSQISRQLKNMSKELSVPVICLAQMNRSVESEKRLPRLSDLRESGAIEQDANAVLFLHRQGDLKDGQQQVLFLLAKGRDVGESFRKTVFVPDHQRFYAIEGEA